MDRIRDAIDTGGGQCCDIEGVLRELAKAGFVIVPRKATDNMIDMGLAATSAWLDIPGSALTVNREKMRRRYHAMVDAYKE